MLQLCDLSEADFSADHPDGHKRGQDLPGSDALEQFLRVKHLQHVFFEELLCDHNLQAVDTDDVDELVEQADVVES